MMPFEERKSKREIGKLIGKLDSAMTLADHIDQTPETHKQIAQLQKAQRHNKAKVKRH